ncbi:MAG: MerR family transcriptional regulator [Roseburia sp.]
MEKVRYMISDAAAMAGVETHVLRYWEEELDLTIPRNEMVSILYTRKYATVSRSKN